MPAKWRTGFVPLQDLTVIAAEPGFTEDSKVAFSQGYFEMAAPLLLPPPPGVVRFPDGSTMKLTLQNEEDAYAALDRGDCAPGECHTLRITDVRLSTIDFLTSRGTARVPAWEFTVAGLHAPVYRVAVPPAAITQVPSMPDTRTRVPELRGAESLTSVAGRTITFMLGVGVCDKDIKAWAYETGDAIVVGGTARTTGEVCVAMLKLVPQTVTLQHPAGTRAILDAASGQPLVIR